MNTRLLDVKDKGRYQEYLREAAEALRSGEVVAFPTETVYGLGVNAQDEKAVKNLYAVKQRPQEKEFARIICNLEEIDWLLEQIEAPVHQLIERFWPGPLTIVFSGYNRKDIGVRFPDHKVAQDLVRLSGVLVLATSANISGGPPATSAGEVMATMGGKIRLVLDGGPCRLKIPSTVVKISKGSYQILRIGAIPEEAINECMVAGPLPTNKKGHLIIQ
ncbi:MAG: L-threonylcarbamoyladenylate synthase [Candidatus Brocadiaceae bacterium]|nr:L-threonylcarbamoyladenylate synthase [Candidatus Brocadiaceae bacterium]